MTAQTNRRMGIDEFMNAGGDRNRGGAFHSWKKEGSTKVWLPRKEWCVQTWNHPIPMVIEVKDRETGDKRLIVRTDRWNCHESVSLLLDRYNRTSSGAREKPPVVCPGCIFPEVLRELIDKGLIDWKDPILQWEGDDPDESITVRAAGAYNGFNSKDVDRSKDLIRELKKAGIRRDTAWNQSLVVRMQWLFLVVDDAKVGEGILKSFEAKGLGDKMKKAIKDELRKAEKQGSRDAGNPLVNPYPFEWSFDETKQFDEKYDVLALVGEKPSAEVLALIDGPAPNIDDELEKGNCFWLKNELESHWIHPFKFPWERVFGPAEKAGLMVPPNDTKEDADEDDDAVVDPDAHRLAGRVPEVGKQPETYVVGPEHEVWFEGAKVDPAVKGKFVELEAPEGGPIEGGEVEPPATDAEIKAATDLLVAWGAAAVALVVECDHCGGRMTTLDADCPACGAEYDDDGKMVSRPCLADAKHQVKLDGEGPNFICGTCATIHVLAPETPDLVLAARWSRAPVEKKAEAKPEEAPTRRRRLAPPDPAKAELASAKAEEPPPELTRQRRGVPFDQPRTGK